MKKDWVLLCQANPCLIQRAYFLFQHHMVWRNHKNFFNYKHAGWVSISCFQKMEFWNIFWNYFSFILLFFTHVDRILKNIPLGNRENFCQIPKMCSDYIFIFIRKEFRGILLFVLILMIKKMISQNYCSHNAQIVIIAIKLTWGGNCYYLYQFAWEW